MPNIFNTGNVRMVPLLTLTLNGVQGLKSTAVQENCGIASNLGKTWVFGQEGPPPPGIETLGQDVWQGDKPPHQRGAVVLGSPIGHPEYVRAWAEARLHEEQQLLQQLPQLPDLQCAWLLLTLCASPRANHAVRTVPPTQVASYAAQHDQAIWETLQACLGGVPEHARRLATLPADMGGLGLQSAQRTSPAAYWAAWMDALPVLRARSPAFADRCLQALEGSGAQAPCLQEAADARQLMQHEGWRDCPSWREACDGARPPTTKQTPEAGQVAGSNTHRGFETPTIAKVSCCRRCTRPPGRCCAHKAALTRAHGSPSRLASRQ